MADRQSDSAGRRYLSQAQWLIIPSSAHGFERQRYRLPQAERSAPPCRRNCASRRAPLRRSASLYVHMCASSSCRDPRGVDVAGRFVDSGSHIGASRSLAGGLVFSLMTPTTPLMPTPSVTLSQPNALSFAPLRMTRCRAAHSEASAMRVQITPPRDDLVKIHNSAKSFCHACDHRTEKAASKKDERPVETVGS